MLIGGYVGSLIFTLWLRTESSSSFQSWLMSPIYALVVLLFAAGYAVLPVFVFGWPGYAWLIYRGHASYMAALAIAISFTLAVWVFADSSLAAVVGLFGACIALATHSALPKISKLSAASVIQ